METGMPGSANALVRINSVAAQTEKRMDTRAPLTAVYFHTVPALPAQPSAATPATFHLPSLYPKETLPFLTLHIAGGLQSQPGLSLAAAAPAARPKSAGKHVCPHCGRDCMKPSVLEKHLRCHTGERPYPCTTCGVSFKTQSNLYKHKRTQAHARLSSESEQSSMGSLDSMSSSREICSSSLSLDECSEWSGSMEKEATLPAAENTFPASTAKVYSVKTQGSVSEPNELSPEGHNTEPNESAKVTIKGEKQTMANEKPALTASRHLPLQRQEATLFSKQWESSVSRGKSQSHESTDSGFSESSDHYPSPGSVLPDHGMDSHTKSTKEHLEENTSTQTSSEPGPGGQEPKDTAREQEQKTLEERISKLISENTAVVEDKQLENIRPRKTVLSKQGSIDLPMPYTYKDSFHFDMRISKTPNVGLQRKAGFYSSVPTQHSTTMEHASLIRSNSLPFSVTLLQPERSSPTSSYPNDNVTPARRGSSGQINPTGFTIKPVNQQSATHRPLVRQAAVDCNHATDGLVNSSVEEAYAGSLSCDGDSGDICGEPNNRKLRRKKAQKFAYNKWYMYGGGTFKKLYNAEKGGDDSAIKGRKCLTNPKHEAGQGLQKRVPAVQKEAVTTTGSTTDSASSSATGCHPGCLPAKLSPVSAVDFNLKTSQPYTSCSSLKTPHRSNLSLSVLPLPLIGSLVSHKKDNMSRTEAGRLSHEKEHTDSRSQLCGSHIPSDRKKQKTDDQLTCEMETDPNTLTHPPPSVTGSALQQDTNLSYVNHQKNEKHTPLKAALFPPCIISANTSSVSSSPSSFTPSFTKTSFLPKYQLKLPHAAEPDSKMSTHDANKLTVTDGRSFLSPSYAEQTSPSVATSENKCSDPVTSPLTQSCDIKKTNAYSSKQGQPLLPCVATALCQTETSRLNKNGTSSLAVVHRQFASTTITTTCLQDYKAGLCNASTRPSKSAGGSASVQLPRPVTPAVVTFPATPTLTPANNPTSAAGSSQGQLNPSPPLSRTQLPQASDQLSPANRAHAGSNTPIVSCHIVPFDQMQPATQNVFHVHTADLQICLQIISDEQLALIEPQIERQAGSTLSNRCDMKAVAPGAIQNKAQSSVTMESSNEGMDHRQPGHHKEVDENESSPTLNMDRIKPPLSVQFGKATPNLSQTEHSNSTQATVSAESKLPGALGSLRHPHKCGHVNTVTETQSSTGDVMSTSASLKGEKSGRSQTSEGGRALSLNYCAEEQHLADKRVSQGGLVSQTLSGQHKPHMTFLSSSTLTQNSLRSEIPSTESQHKLQIQRALCNVGIIKAKSEASAYTSNRLESGEARPPLQSGLGQASGAVCADELSGSAVSFSISEYRTPRQLNAQACIYCSSPVESTLSEALKSFRHANMACDRPGLSEDPAPSQEMSERESQDVISSAHSEEKQLGLFTSMSSNIQVDRTSPAMLLEGASPAGCAAQEEPQTRGNEESPKQSQEIGETKHQCTKGQGGGGVAGESKNRGAKAAEKPGQRGKAEPNCRDTCLQAMTKPEGEDGKVEADSFKNSWLYEQHLSQAHSEMSEFPPPSLQPATSTSDNLHLAACSSQASLFNSPHPPLEMNNFYLPQQHWESGIIHNQQTHFLCESNSSHRIKAQAQLTEAQNAFSQVESSPQQTQPTVSHQDQKQDRTQTSVTLSAQQGNTTAGNNIAAVSCCAKLTSESHISISPDVKTSSSTHPSHMSYSIQVSRATAGMTVDTRPSNNNALDNDNVLPSKPFTYPEPDDYQDTKDTAPNDYTSQSCNFGRPDITNKYQSFLFAGPLHGYQTAECLTSGVRPVQSCQDYTEDTSSSDDEGKLIIEL